MRYFKIIAVVILAGGLAMACGSKRVVKSPEPSSLQLVGEATDQATLAVSDVRSDQDKPVSIGRISTTLINLEDEIGFLKTHLAAELEARGLSVVLGEGDATAYQLQVSKFRIRNHQINGWAPHWTCTTLAADFVNGDQTQHIAVFYRFGKTAMTSSAVQEQTDTCYSLPVSLMVKEIVAKINRYTVGYKLSDEEVTRLIEATSGMEDSRGFENIYELGFSNNPIAVPHLLALTEDKNDTIAAAALSALGILGAVEAFELLKTVYQARRADIVKLSALKAIGDLNTPEAQEFMAGVHASADYAGNANIKEVVDLYL